MGVRRNGSNIASIRRNGTGISKIYRNNKLVFSSDTGAVTVSGSINDSGVVNGNASDSYSATCNSDDNIVATFYIGPDEGYSVPSDFSSSDVTFSGFFITNFWEKNDWSCAVSGSQILCTGTEPCPNNNRTDNFSVSYSGFVADQPVYGPNDWNGFLAINNQGVISVTLLGNATSVDILTANFSSISGCAGQNRTVQVSVTVPSGYSNSGQQVTVSKQVFQPATGANFSISDWTGSVTYDSNGSPSITNGNLTNVSAPNVGSWQGCSSINRTVTISGTVSSSYCNSGNRSFTYTASQSGSGVYLNPQPSISIAVNGTVTPDYDGLTGGSINISKFSDRSQNCGSLYRCVTVTGTVPSGYCDSGSFSRVVCANQPGGNDDYQAGDYDGTISIGSSSGVVSVGNGTEFFVNYWSPTNVSANDTCSNRTYNITITGDVSEDSDHCDNGATDKKIVVAATQSPIYSSFSFPCSQVGVNANGIVTKPSYATASPSAFSKVKTATSRTVSLTGTIPFGYCNTGQSFTASCTVTQPASAANTLSVDKTTMEFDGSGGELSGDTINVTVTPASSFSVSDNRSWLHTSTSGNVITVSVDDNPGGANRKGVITVRHTLDTTIVSTITVTQYGDI